MDLIAIAAKSNHYVDRKSGVMQRVEKVDDRYVYLSVLMPLISTWALATAEYDATWATRFVPVDMGAMGLPPGYRPPANTAPWVTEPAPAEDVRFDETTEGVAIGGV